MSTESATTDTSTQTVITSIIVNGVICAVFVTLFFICRTRFRRIYEPKSYYQIGPENERTKPLPLNPILWILELIQKDSKFIINQAGIDGYLFIRFLFVSGTTFLFGMLTWIILLPINASNGKGETGFNQLSISNVGSPRRYYAHVFMSWFFYGGVMFVIYREIHFYCKLKFAAMSTPYYAKKLSSRTVIFQSVPNEYLDESEFFKLFNGVKKVWLARGQSKLTKKVSERNSLCDSLENSLNGLLKKAYKVEKNAEKNGEIIEPANELVCYIPQKKWPKKKLSGWWNPFGEKMDLIDYCLDELPKLNKEIEVLQANFRASKPMNSIIVEFENQYYAQLAYQSTIHSSPLHFSPKEIGREPEDIFWPNMRLFWWELLGRKSAAISFIIFLIMIWAIPVAFVGLISNLTYLTNKIHGLRFIYRLPKDLLGLITSLLPTVLLSILMMFLPIFIRTAAKVAGCKTTQTIELFTQQSTFAFQVIHTFLVVTIASSVTSVVTQILEHPSSVLSILSNNLPKSSNFFISYIILQGFTIAGGSLFQVIPMILFYILSFFFDGTLRKKYVRWNNIGSYAWGTNFPSYTILAVITLSYAIISPMILIFASFAFLITWVSFLNNATYVVGKGTDSMGVHYPRAMFQMMVGVYLGQICLLGIYAVSKAWGCIVLQAIFLVFSVFFHIEMNQAFDHLLSVVPNSAMRPLDGESETLSWSPPSSQEKGKKSPFYSSEELVEDLSNVPLLVDGDSPEIESTPNVILRFFQPWVYLSFTEVKKYLPDSLYSLPPATYDSEHAFNLPDVSAQCPLIWIPRDPMGLSTTFIEKFKGIVEISDENSEFNVKGGINFTGPIPTPALKSS